MSYENLIKELKTKFGNHCYVSNVSGGNLICFPMCEKAQNDITAEVLRFNND